MVLHSFLVPKIINIDRTAGGYQLNVRDANSTYSMTGTVVVNAAGLLSDRVAQLAGIDIGKSGYRLHYCKGEYFSLNSKISRLVNSAHAVPEKAGLGVHVTLSLDGCVRLGPNAKYVDIVEYAVDENDKTEFYQAAHRYLPSIQFDDLSPDFAGIRPKLQNKGDAFRDFIIRYETDKGLPGLINLSV